MAGTTRRLRLLGSASQFEAACAEDLLEAPACVLADLVHCRQEMIALSDVVMASPGLTTVCAWCSRVKVGGIYVEGVQEPEGRISHGICPECARKARAEIGLAA